MCEGEKYWHQQSGSKNFNATFSFLSIKNNSITIWSCMLLEDVMELLFMLMPQIFVQQFFFTWGMWTSMHDIMSIQHKNTLLPYKFEIYVFCLSRTSLWKKIKIKHCSLTMSQRKPFEIPIVIVFPLNPLEDKSCQIN
jgi:hypothetical protein